jgi:hypothetical protein
VAKVLWRCDEMIDEEEKKCESCGTAVNGLRICPTCGACCVCG